MPDDPVYERLRVPFARFDIDITVPLGAVVGRVIVIPATVTSIFVP